MRKIRGDTVAYDGSLKFDTKVDRQGLESGLAQLKSIATKSLAAIGAAAVAGIGAAVKVGMDFETSLAKVGTIADTSVKSLDAFSKEAVSLSQQTGIAGTEINEALYQAISAGADTEHALGLVEVAAKAAKGGFTDTATAVDGLTSVLNTYGMATADADKLANQFLITQNLGKTTFGQLASSIGLVAPVAKSAGVSTQELLSSIAALTANGLGTSEAITGVKAALSNVIKPSSEATKMAKKLGIDFSVTAMQSKGLAGFMAELAEKTGGNTDTMAQLFGSVEGLNAVLTLTSSGGMELMNKTMREMETNATALDDAYNEMNSTTEAAFNKLKTSAQGVGISFYEGIQEPLKQAAITGTESIQEIASSMQSGGLQSAVESVGRLLASLVTTLTNFASSAIPVVINSLAFLANNFDKLAIVAAACFSAMKAYTVITAISNALKGASAAVAAYTTATAASQHVSLLLALTMTPLQLAVGVLTGKITLATAAQAAWNAVMNANPIGIIITLLAALAAGIALAYSCSKKHKSAIDEETKAQRERAEAIKKVRESQIEANKASEESMKSGLAEASYLKRLKDELGTLVDANGKVKDGYQDRVNFILNELNQAFGTEYKLIDGVIQKYNELNSSVDKYIAKKQLQTIIDAKQPEYNQAKGEYTTNANAASKALQDLETARAKLEAAEVNLAKKQSIEASKSLTYWRQEVERLEQTYKTASDSAQESWKDITDYEALATAMASEDVEKMKAALASYNDSIKSSAELSKEYGEQAKAESVKQMQEYLGGFKYTLSQFQQGNTAVNEQIVEGARESVRSTVLAWTESGGRLAELAPIFAAQGVNLVDALGDGAEGGSAAFYGKLAEITNLSVEQVKALLIPGMGEAGQEAHDNLEEGANQPVNLDELGGSTESEVGNAAQSGVAAADGASEIPEAVENNADQNVTLDNLNSSAESETQGAVDAGVNAAQNGEQVPAALSESLNGDVDASGLEGSTENAVNTAIDNSTSAADGAASIGTEIMNKAAEGVAQSLETLSNAAKEAIDSTINVAKFAAASAVSVGEALIDGVTSGVNSRAQTLASAAAKVVTDAVEAARVVAEVNSPSKLTRREIGMPLIEGIVSGINRQAGALSSALSGSLTGAVKDSKAIMGIHSPSRVTYNEVGVPLVDGITTAIEDHGYEIGEAFENALADLDLLRDYGIIGEAEYYKRLEALRDEHIKAGTEEWHKYTLELVKYDQEQADKELDILNKRYDKGKLSEKEYYSEVTRIRDAYFTEGTAAWNEFTQTICDNVQDHAETIKESIADSFKDALSEVESAQSSMTDKLKSNVSLLETHTYIETDKDGKEMTTTIKGLSNLEEETRNLEAYRDALLSVRDRLGGRKADALFQEIREMGISEGADILQQLLSLSDDKFSEYVDSYNRYQNSLADISESIYHNDYQEVVAEQLASSRAQLEKYFGELPDDFFSCGVNSAEQFGVGMKNGIFQLFEDIRHEVSNFMAEIAPQFSFGIGGIPVASGGDTYAPTYQIYNPAGDANAAIRAAKERERLDRLRRLTE